MLFGLKKMSERYDFHGRVRDARKEYATAVFELHLRYPEYDYVWDRRKERWLCIHWRSYPSKGRPIPVCYLENEDGTRAEPGPWFVEWLLSTDWRNTGAKSVEDFIRKMESAEKTFEVNEEARVEDEESYMRRQFLKYIHDNPTTVSAPIPRWSLPQQLYMVTKSLDASCAASSPASAGE